MSHCMQPQLASPDRIVPYLAHGELAYGMEYGVDTYRAQVPNEEARAGDFMNAPQAKRLVLSRRAQAVEEKFLLRYLRGSLPECESRRVGG